MTHMRLLRPAENVLAFYDGRVEGYRYAPERNWVDEGALTLGIASYAVIAGDHALIYDTHVSVEHAALIREGLKAEGVASFTVVLSHCHLDHIAGTAAFQDCEVIGCDRTAEQLTEKRAAIEQGTLAGPPANRPARPANAGVL
jgi:glyoxylase-like metal-dependent hydrolase (beta-lactamase superfamily II)